MTLTVLGSIRTSGPVVEIEFFHYRIIPSPMLSFSSGKNEDKKSNILKYRTNYETTI